MTTATSAGDVNPTQTAAIGAEAMRNAFEAGADTKASYEQGDGDRCWSAELDDEFEMFMRNYPALSQPVAAPQADWSDEAKRSWEEQTGQPSDQMPQPEGCTVADKVSRIIEGYAESYDMMGRINPDNYSFCASVSVDLRRNILGAILAALQPEKTK